MAENVYDKSKLAFHKSKILAIKNGEITAPIYVRFKPTNRCNHACFYCSYKLDTNCRPGEVINQTDELPLGKTLETLLDFRDIGVKAVTYSGGGEPLIYPYINQAVQKTLEYGLDLSVITNGQKLNGRIAKLLTNAEWVRISSGECNAKLFEEVRRRPQSWFYELAKNIETFAKIKGKDCELGINFVVNKKNADTVYDAAVYFSRLGVNHIKFTPVYFPDFKEYHKDIKDNVVSQIKRARQDLHKKGFVIYDTYDTDFSLSGIAERKYDHCPMMQVLPVVGADANVYFCHDKAYSESGILGSIKHQSFRELWFSKETAKIFRNFNPAIGCKHHCNADSKNLLILQMVSDLGIIKSCKPKSEKHKNFI